jgi:hypothetical protein
MKNTFELNGKLYVKKEQSRPIFSRKMGMLMAMAQISSGLMYGGSNEPERPKVNLIEEYGLIEQKKSKLSKSQRDWVVSQFKKYYQEITNENI